MGEGPQPRREVIIFSDGHFGNVAAQLHRRISQEVAAPSFQFSQHKYGMSGYGGPQHYLDYSDRQDDGYHSYSEYQEVSDAQPKPSVRGYRAEVADAERMRRILEPLCFLFLSFVFLFLVQDYYKETKRGKRS